MSRLLAFCARELKRVPFARPEAGYAFGQAWNEFWTANVPTRQYATETHPPEVVQSVLASEGVQQQLQSMRDRHAELSRHLSGDSSEVSAKEVRGLHQELARLEPMVEMATALADTDAEMRDLRQLLEETGRTAEDREMTELIQYDLQQTRNRRAELQQQVLQQLLSQDSAKMDSRNAILEVRPGIGGDEAALFALDLWNMYRRFAERQGWRFEVLDLALAEQGGCKHGSASISGENAYGMLKWESGGHRVQRVPDTEGSGRIHTSAATVIVMAEVDQVDLEIRDSDLRIDTFRASGAGGQHVNTTDSAVRITHIPTGLAVSIQDERSQHKNKAKAMKVLRATLFKLEEERRQAATSESKMELSGSGDRSERIRTYNFPQGRVTDHRVGHTEHNMDRMMDGDLLEPFISALTSQAATDRLLNLAKTSSKAS
mmetsp:Transcript_5846/g.16690  ORF Transcript_5846/g.16690 Transcript_5846/m.16690 type:complete len:431 (+) Transcript_5846:175-1467(+)